MTETGAAHQTVQLHLSQSYKLEVRTHPEVRRYLDRGFRITQLQRVTDKEVLVTLTDAPLG